MEVVQVSAGNLLLYLGILSCCSAAVFLLKGKIKPGVMFTRLSAAFVTLAVMLLAYSFVSLDYSLFYVWQHVNEQMPIFYRLAAIMVGQEGTYLVWAWLCLVVVLVHTERHKISERPLLTNVYALIGCAFLLILTVGMSPFKSIFTVEGASLPVSGNGLDPALLDLLMPLHIFSVFAAYAFTIIPAAASLAYLTRGEMPGVRNYLRFSWLFLSIGMITGGIWANRLLGWSGFWQWDPVQSSILATWLLLTAALHALVRFAIGEYKKWFPLLCINTFLLTIYTTFVARSGIYSSIHSFPGTPSWWLLIVFMAAVIVISLVLGIRYDAPETLRSGGIRAAFAPHNTFYFTVALLLLMAFISLWGPTVYILLFYTGQKIVMFPEYYNVLFYPFILGLSYLLGACMLYGRVKNRTLAFTGVIYFAASFFLSIAVPDSAHAVAAPGPYAGFLEKILGSFSVTSYLPAFFFITGTVLFKMIRDSRIKNRVVSLHLTGVNLLHLGIIFIILGAIFSTSFETSQNFSYAFNEKGVYKEKGGIGLQYLDFRLEREGADWLQVVDFEVFDGERMNMSAVYRKSRQFGFISNAAVHHGIFSDIKVDFEGLLPHQLQQGKIGLNVKKQPLASLMWLGSAMLISGILLTIIASLLSRRQKETK